MFTKSLLVIAVMLMISSVKATMLDISRQEGYEEPTINIEELPEVDPWSEEGSALARFEQLRDQASEVVSVERDVHEELAALKKQIRMAAMQRDGSDLGEAPQELVEQVEQLTRKAMEVKEQKLAASNLAQQAYKDFNDLMRNKELEAQQLERMKTRESIMMRMGQN